MFFSKRPELFLKKSWPTYYSKAKGCYIWDLDKIRYIDCSYMGIGTNLLGYANKNIDNNIHMQINRLHRLYYKIIKPYQEKNNIQYDYFIKIRPDFVFYRNCIPPIDKWNSKKISCRMRVYPTKISRLYFPTFFEIGQEVIDDQFFIIPKYLEEYAFRIDYGNYPKKTTLNYQEAIQTKLWNSHNIKYELIYVNGTLNKWKNKF